MWCSIAEVVRQFKQAWTRHLEDHAIEVACHEAGHTWRDRLLNPVMTVRLFFLQILYGNTACAHLPHLSALSFTAAAYCEARKRLPLSVFTALLERTTRQLNADLAAAARWLGHRVFLVDGSNFSMPDTLELRGHFGQPGGQKPGCGFPVAHWLVLMHAATGMVLKMLTAPLRTHDMSGVAELHPELKRDDVLVADRGFCSFAHLALLVQRGVHGVLRAHQRLLVDFTPARPHASPRGGKNAKKTGQPRSRWLKSLGVTDQLVEWLKPVTCPSWMPAEQFAALPERLTMRELQYRVNRRGFRTDAVTLVTTLLDAERYSAVDLAALYAQRWSVETNFDHLKTTMRMDVLRCQTVAGVLKELTMFVLVYNLVRLVMLEAAKRQRVPAERISFVDALRWLATAKPGDRLHNLVVNPHRPWRVEPRVRKRRPKEYPLMQEPRAVLRQRLMDGPLAP